MKKQKKTRNKRVAPSGGVYFVRTLNVKVDDFVRLNEIGRTYLEKHKKHGGYFPKPGVVYMVREIEFYPRYARLFSPSISSVSKKDKKSRFPFAMRLKEKINNNGKSSWEDYDDLFYSVRHFDVVDENGRVLRRERRGIR